MKNVIVFFFFCYNRVFNPVRTFISVVTLSIYLFVLFSNIIITAYSFCDDDDDDDDNNIKSYRKVFLRYDKKKKVQ